MKFLTAPLQKGFLVLLLCVGCGTVKVKPDYPSMLKAKDAEIKQLKEVVSFEEKMVDYGREDLKEVEGDFLAMRRKVDTYLKLRHGCKHVGVLR